MLRTKRLFRWLMVLTLTAPLFGLSSCRFWTDDDDDLGDDVEDILDDIGDLIDDAF